MSRPGPVFLSSVFTHARSPNAANIPEDSHELLHKIVIPKMGVTGE
jgi:hypothetical protein